MRLAVTVRQMLAVTWLNLASLPGRLGAATVAVMGIGGVVTVLIAVLSISEGFRAAMELSGRDDIGVVLRGGSSDELSSGLSLDAVRNVLDSPGILQDDAGPLASPARLWVYVAAAHSREGGNFALRRRHSHIN